jgi:hypothetical protein
MIIAKYTSSTRPRKKKNTAQKGYISIVYIYIPSVGQQGDRMVDVKNMYFMLHLFQREMISEK